MFWLLRRAIWTQKAVEIEVLLAALRKQMPHLEVGGESPAKDSQVERRFCDSWNLCLGAGGKNKQLLGDHLESWLFISLSFVIRVTSPATRTRNTGRPEHSW